MKLSVNLEASAQETLRRHESISDGLIEVDGTPFFLSLTPEGLTIHGTIEYGGRSYFIGTREGEAE